MKLEEIGRIVKAATEGPWEVDTERRSREEHTKEDLPCWSWYPRGAESEFEQERLAWETDSGVPGYGLKKPDADFCATMRNEIEDLLAVALAAKHFREMQETYEQDPTCEECQDYRNEAYSLMEDALEKFK